MIGLGLGIGLTKAASGASFDPATLFAEGEEGFWYEPAKLLDDQTATPSAAAGDGDPVGYAYDHSGNGNHATQSVDTSYRPTLNASNGKWYYEGDGTDDYLRSGTVDLTGTGQITFAMAVEIPSWTLGDIYVCTNPLPYPGTVGGFKIENDAVGGARNLKGFVSGASSWRVVQSATTSAHAFGQTSVQRAVLRAKIDVTQSDTTELRLFWNGQEISRSYAGADTGSSVMANLAWDLFGQGTSNASPIKIFGAMLVGRETTGEEDANIDTYLAGLIDWPIADVFDVFIVGGDSNAIGAGYPKDAGDISDGAYWAPDSTGHTNFNSVLPANNSFNGQANGGNPSIGPWTAFIRTYMAAHPGRVPLIVYAPWGGTGHSDGNWTVTTGTYYQRLLDLTENAMASRVGNTLKGILWLSGTNDTGFAGDPTYTGAQWSSAMQAMVAGLRSTIPGATDLPLVIGPLVPDFIVSNGSAAEDIEAAIQDLPNQITNCAAIDPTGLTLPSIHPTVEPHHFNAVAQRNLGPEFYSAWAGLT